MARRFSLPGHPLPRPASLLGTLLLAATALLCAPQPAGGHTRYGLSPALIRPILASAAAAQGGQGPANPTQPIALAHESWEGVLHRFSTALIDPIARATEEPLFVPGNTVQRFGEGEPTIPRVIADRFDGFARASVCAFIHPMPGALDRLDSDLSADDSPVPPAARQALIPPPRERGAAHATFARWIQNALDPQPGDRYGLIVLVQPEQPQKSPTSDFLIAPAGFAARSAPPAPPTPFDRVTLLLVKAAQQPDGRWRLAHVRYGTLVEAIQYGY